MPNIICEAVQAQWGSTSIFNGYILYHLVFFPIALMSTLHGWNYGKPSIYEGYCFDCHATSDESKQLHACSLRSILCTVSLRHLTSSTGAIPHSPSQGKPAFIAKLCNVACVNTSDCFHSLTRHSLYSECVSRVKASDIDSRSPPYVEVSSEPPPPRCCGYTPARTSGRGRVTISTTTGRQTDRQATGNLRLDNVCSTVSKDLPTESLRDPNTESM